MTGTGRRPRWRRRLLGVPLAALVVTLAACGSAGDRQPTTTTTPYVTATGGTMAVGIDEAPTGCNPNVAGGDTWANRLVLAPVLPSAFTVDAAGQSVINTPFLDQAELINTNPQTVVYTINQKAVWGDGTPISAADFVYAWEHQRGTIIDPAHTWGDEASTLGYSDITSVTGSNHGRTVTAVFKTAFADWQALFADLLPAHVLEKVGWDPPCTTVSPLIDLSGGPFMIRSASAGVVVMVPNPRWWGQAANLDRLVVKVASGDPQLVRWLASGAVQVIQPKTFGQPFLETVAALRGANSELDVSSTFLQLEFSTTGAATTDPNVRAAVAHAVDRQSITETTVGWADLRIVPSQSHLYVQTQAGYPGPTGPPPNGSGTTTTTVVPNSQAYPATADLAQTKRLLTGAGYTQFFGGAWLTPAGTPFTLRLVIDQSDAWAVAAGTELVRQLERAGIAVVATAAPDAVTAGTDLASGAADVALLAFSASPYPSQTSAWYTPFLGPPGQGGSQNWPNLDDTTVNDAYQQAATQLNPVDGQPLYDSVDQQLWAQMVGLPLFAEPTVLAWANLTSGVQAYPFSPGLLVDAPSWSVLVPAPKTTTNSSVKVGPGVT